MENKKYFSNISVDDTFNYIIQNSEKKEVQPEKIIDHKCNQKQKVKNNSVKSPEFFIG